MQCWFASFAIKVNPFNRECYCVLLWCDVVVVFSSLRMFIMMCEMEKFGVLLVFMCRTWYASDDIISFDRIYWSNYNERMCKLTSFAWNCVSDQYTAYNYLLFYYVQILTKTQLSNCAKRAFRAYFHYLLLQNAIIKPSLKTGSVIYLKTRIFLLLWWLWACLVYFCCLSLCDVRISHVC